MPSIKSKLSYANLTASLALFVALGGTSYAVTQLPRDSVGSAQIRSGAVRSPDLHKDSVTSRAVDDRSIALRDISTAARSALEGATGPKGDPGVAFRAAINSGGVAVAGNPVGATHNGGTGVYSIAFGQDVSGCTATASLAAVANGPVVEQPPAGRITVAADGPRVAVHTYDAAGAVADAPFNLLVAC